ncbi:MAG: hypothetical protein WD071_00875 [Pseudohongiella sp.]|uniref:alginate export family protein n=1 Tax=Pseudohongiella sp. TaxID=1979412 RepID=UPI0034A01558
MKQDIKQNTNMNTCKTLIRLLAGSIFSTALLVSLPLMAAENSADSLAAALSQGNTTLSFRLRHEDVQVDTPSRDATANTLRSRLTYTSARWSGLDATLEMDYVATIGNEKFNNTRNNQFLYATVPDPDGADLNIAALRYRFDTGSAVMGRQRLVRGNQRFIGSVGWRQNEQTFDALNLSWQASARTQFSYAWIDNTRRIFGPDKGTPAAKLASNHHLLDASMAISDAININAYYYALDFEQAPALSSRTAGLTLSGAADAVNSRLDYRLEAARQDDYGNNPVNYDAMYWLASAGLTAHGIRIGFTHEILGADSRNNASVQTPLATLHAFQGWADQFLTTPAVGIKDNSISVSGTVSGTRLSATWHDYQSDTHAMSLGSEWNLQAHRVFAERYTLTLKYADYQSDGFGSDTQKLWLMAEARF